LSLKTGVRVKRRPVYDDDDDDDDDDVSMSSNSWTYADLSYEAVGSDQPATMTTTIQQRRQQRAAVKNNTAD